MRTALDLEDTLIEPANTAYPLHRLLTAVLHQALRDATQEKNRRWQQDAVEWIESDACA